ncbi:PTS lactose/cellobiose transporter subunit IIA [Pectinatus brassicae]|uniref:PTS system cellobiose-specific IIA component n=1 Tax=Pectinatus brassicae TaxID=862415 RepID=A0A840UQE4_9FIRM|nr:PTS lactose/cellobiose transporter subunit IIA [Pectinatus brassicae]MBB5335223.1 PTS system cellobiose-specific IIA component [Pectinatus brassicae]
MEGSELIAFNIISAVGTARSCYIEAIQKAKTNDFIAAEKLIAEGDDAFNEGHDVHLKLLQSDAEGKNNSNINLLILHAEDQLMSAEGFKIIATEFIDVYKKLKH